MAASSLLAVAVSGLWVVSDNTGQNEDMKPFLPLQIMVKDPFPEHMEMQGAYRYAMAI